jgi:hypothetical protein
VLAFTGFGAIVAFFFVGMVPAVQASRRATKRLPDV